MANSQELEDLLNQYKSFMGPPVELQGSDDDLENELAKEPVVPEVVKPKPIMGEERVAQLLNATQENPAPFNPVDEIVDPQSNVPDQMEPAPPDEDQQILEQSPEWTGKPAAIDFNNPMKTLMAYQAARRPAESNLNYLMAGSKVGQGISQLFGGKIDDNMEQVKHLDKQLDKPLAEYEKLLKLNKDATGSLAARASGFGLFTNNAGEPLEKNNVTGQLWNVLKNRPHADAEGIVVRGVPKLFTGEGGEVYERLPGRPQTPTAITGPEGMIRKGTGAKLEGDVEPEASSPEVVSPEAGDVPKKTEKAFQPNREQKTALDKETDRLDGLTKDINAKIDAVSRLSQTLASNSKLTGAMVKTQFPRLAGEVGNLNQQEQEVWQGSSALLDRVNQYVSTLSDSTLTDSNKKELKKLIDIFSNTSNSAMSSIMSASANRLKMVRNIPEDFTLQAYGQLRKPLKGKVKLGPDEKVTDHNGKKLIWNIKTNKAVRWLKDNEQ